MCVYSTLNKDSYGHVIFSTVLVSMDFPHLIFNVTDSSCLFRIKNRKAKDIQLLKTSKVSRQSTIALEMMT